jgi:hypothetical protein
MAGMMFEGIYGGGFLALSMRAVRALTASERVFTLFVRSSR